MKLYESNEQMMAWDFIENKKIDVIEEDDDLDKEVSYICPRCQKHYKEKADSFYKKECEECCKSDMVYYVSGKWKTRYYLGETFRYLLMVVFSLLPSVISLKLETFDIQFAYMTICYMVFFIGAYMLLSQFFHFV